MIHTLFKLYYEVIFTLKNVSNYVNTILFYVIVLLLFPVGINYQINILYIVSIPIICVCVFLIMLFTLEDIFTNEVSKGYLFEYHFIQHNIILKMVFIKLLIKWLSTFVCVFIGTFMGFIFFNIDRVLFLSMMKILLPNILVLTAIGAIGSSLMVGYKNKNMLLSVIVIPFYIPVLISTIGMLNTTMQDAYITSQNTILILFFIVLICISPIICSYVLKIWNE